MPHTITIDGAGTALQQYSNRFSPQIHQTIKQGLELEQLLPITPCDYAYTGQEVEVGDVLQPYQAAFTPNNAETFDGITSFLQIGKIDLNFDAIQLEKFYSKWRVEWFEAGKDPMMWSYPRYIIDNHINPKAIEELNLASWAGERVVPTPGTPGASLESFDGFKKVIGDLVTAGRIVPIATGALVANTMVAQVRGFCKSIPEPYRYRNGIILASKTRAQDYADNYQTLYPSRRVNEEQQDQLYLRVDHYNKTIVGISAMEGDDRLICIFPNLPSMTVGTRDGYPRFFNYRFDVIDREVRVYSELYRFFSFETTKHCFMNDQA